MSTSGVHAWVSSATLVRSQSSGIMRAAGAGAGAGVAARGRGRGITGGDGTWTGCGSLSSGISVRSEALSPSAIACATGPGVSIPATP